nr:MAG TPA: hypothetical protein [Caudoviricetes sp.]
MSLVYPFNSRTDRLNRRYFSNHGVPRLCKPRDYKRVGTLSNGTCKRS